MFNDINNKYSERYTVRWSASETDETTNISKARASYLGRFSIFHGRLHVRPQTDDKITAAVSKRLRTGRGLLS